jgi:chromosome segregation ATPase
MDNVSKELFTSEIKNVKGAMHDIKTDIRTLNDTIKEVSALLHKVDSNHQTHDLKFSHLGNSLTTIVSSLNVTSDSLAKVNARISTAESKIESIEKYPVYTKWTLGIFLSLMLIYKYIKESI